MPDIKTVSRGGFIRTLNTGDVNSSSTLTWNSSLDTYNRFGPTDGACSIHHNMRRCLLLSNGIVNYYLDPFDSTKKTDGSAADLSGVDGNVMVEIPRFYFKYERQGDNKTWSVSQYQGDGYEIHPAFIKNGVEVNYRYIGAYDACVYDDSAGTYLSGLNLDDNTGNIDTTNDKLSSVSGIYPLVGVTRDEARKLAANNGTGWRQLDFWLASAIQLLYLVEYGDFNSQANLGDGNTSVSTGYPESSSNQSDSPHSVAGKSNVLGNFSTDSTSGALSSTRDTAFMSYRGIENFFGNCWTWVDGLNVNVSGEPADGWYVNNDDENFTDNTATNYKRVATAMPNDGFVTDIYDTSGAFIPTTVGGSSSTYLTDYYFDDNNSTNRVALLGGGANVGAVAGAFYWSVSASSGSASRVFGARVCY